MHLEDLVHAFTWAACGVSVYASIAHLGQAITNPVVPIPVGLLEWFPPNVKWPTGQLAGWILLLLTFLIAAYVLRVMKKPWQHTPGVRVLLRTPETPVTLPDLDLSTESEEGSIFTEIPNLGHTFGVSGTVTSASEAHP